MTAGRFKVTYDIVTPESAERGDIESAGFIGADGLPAAMLNSERPPAMTLAQAARLIDSSCLEDSGFWFSEADGRQNYRTGAVERRSIHPPENCTAASYERLRRLFSVH